MRFGRSRGMVQRLRFVVAAIALIIGATGLIRACDSSHSTRTINLDTLVPDGPGLSTTTSPAGPPLTDPPASATKLPLAAASSDQDWAVVAGSISVDTTPGVFMGSVEITNHHSTAMLGIFEIYLYQGATLVADMDGDAFSDVAPGATGTVQLTGATSIGGPYIPSQLTYVFSVYQSS